MAANGSQAIPMRIPGKVLMLFCYALLRRFFNRMLWVTKACPHETCPRENGEWGAEITQSHEAAKNSIRKRISNGEQGIMNVEG